MGFSAVRQELPLLTSVQMAAFVAHGIVRFDGVIPDELNAEAIDVFRAGVPVVPWGSPVGVAFPAGSFVHRLLSVPTVAGALHSLVGPAPSVDHHAVHVREPREVRAQPLHTDRIIDTRRGAFDIQFMYYPTDVTLDMGGTLIVPGSHLRRTNEADIARYQNLRGQIRLVCSAGTVLLLHHGVWHAGRQNRSDRRRYLLKIRFNPGHRQLRLWDTTDLDDPRVAEQLRVRFPWCEGPNARLEYYNRVRFWQEISGDPSFDVDHWYSRVHNMPEKVAY